VDGFKRAFRLGGPSRNDAARAVDEELEFHLREAVEELVEEGWSPEEARAEVRRQFGDLEQTRSYCADMQARHGREERTKMTMDALRQDLTYAIRTLRGSPGYVGLVVLTLAFGIAANTTIFSVMNPYFFRPLPYEAPEELVHITQVDKVTGWYRDRVSIPQYEDWKESARALEDLAAYTYHGMVVTGPEGPETVNASQVTANMFDVLGTEALFGRTFLPEEGGPAGEPVAVLDHGFWQRRYGGDPTILGRTLTLDGVQHTVVGVMPPEFVFPFGGVALWTPEPGDGTTYGRDDNWFLLVGRRAPGRTSEEVDAELTAVQARLARAYPDADGQAAGVTVEHMRAALNFGWDIMKVTFGVLLGAVIFVLLIACVNVASLTLARASTRTREVAVRAALGAGRGRIVRQLFTESLLLALTGGVLGVLLAYWAVGLTGPVIPEDLYRVGDMTIDRTVLAFSLVVTLATSVVFGLLPALRATRTNLTEDLKEGSRGSGGLASARGRRALVAIQVALAVVLITGAGLMLRSFASVQQIELGFDADRVLTVSVRPPEASYPAEELDLYVQEALQSLRAVPGVESVSATLHIPLNHETSIRQFASPSLAGAPGEEWPTAIANRPYPGYFGTMGISLLEGRDFSAADNRDAARVVVVNEPLARRYWPQGNAVGSTLLVGDPNDPMVATVIGVVGGVKHSGLDASEERAQLYLPALQAGLRRHFFVVRTVDEPASLTRPVREALLALDPDLPAGVRPMSAVVAENRLQWSIGSVSLAVFGTGALLLAALGVYGLISFSVAQRRRELGVRMALGASRREIRRVVVSDGVRLTAVGLAAGLALALGMGKVIASALYGVTPFDPVTLGGVLVLFLAVAALASFVPAERASRTNPVGALRGE
jgi:putative ABC transport system permease protein